MGEFRFKLYGIFRVTEYDLGQNPDLTVCRSKCLPGALEPWGTISKDLGDEGFYGSRYERRTVRKPFLNQTKEAYGPGTPKKYFVQDGRGSELGNEGFEIANCGGRLVENGRYCSMGKDFVHNSAIGDPWIK